MQLITLTLCLVLLLSPIPAGAGQQSAAHGATPDALENNWSAATATPIAVNYVYQLNFICPIEQGCPGGDHDYMRLPVKTGLRYYLATTDLEPSVDTVIELFWADMDHPIAANDDLNPNSSLLSALEWQAPDNGELVIRVSPRTGGMQLRLPDAETTGYRFAAALAGSTKGAELKRLAEEQASLTPVVVDGTISANAAGMASAAPPASIAELPHTYPTSRPAQIITAEVATGPAQVITATVMRVGPGEEHEELEVLKANTMVKLLGQAGGTWVFVRPAGAIRPGWVQYHNLQLLDPAAPMPAQTTPPHEHTTPTPGEHIAQWKLTRLNAAVPPVPIAAHNSTVVTLDIALVRANSAQTPIAHTRIQIMNAFGDLLSEFVTPIHGRISVQQVIEPGVALRLRIPAAGLELPIDPNKPTIVIEFPDIHNSEWNH